MAPATIVFCAVLTGLAPPAGATRSTQARGITGAPAAASVRRHVPTARAGVYVALGASDSYGVGVADPSTESWPALLARDLPAGTRFVDLGVPGILLRRANQVELPIALDARPTIATVWLAVNDIAAGTPLAQYRRDLDHLLRALHRTGAIVLIANVPDLALVPSLAGKPGLPATITAWNRVIAHEAHAHGAVLVDLYARWQELRRHPDYIGPDGLHPSLDGYRRLAQLFLQTYRHATASPGT